MFVGGEIRIVKTFNHLDIYADKHLRVISRVIAILNQYAKQAFDPISDDEDMTDGYISHVFYPSERKAIITAKFSYPLTYNNMCDMLRSIEQE